MKAENNLMIPSRDAVVDALSRPARLQPAILCLALALLLLGAPLQAQEFKGFVPSGEFTIELDGAELEGAELFKSDQSGAFLIMAPSLKSPVMVNTRAGSVDAVSFMKVSKRDDGTIDLLPGAAYETYGRFQARQKTVTFTVKGQKMVLKSKPVLVGTQTASSLAAHNPGYAFKAEKYQVDDKQVSLLKEESRDVEVKVFFGTWCPVCSRLVPKVMKVSESLNGSKINFEYYGLPRMIQDDPLAEELEIRGVPTGIVYVNGKEVGRLTGRELYKPEDGLAKVLNGA